MPGGSGQVAILLPLSGKLAEIGKPMLRAAQLALSVPGSPTLDETASRELDLILRDLAPLLTAQISAATGA